jgi:hypothetical protein
MIQHVMFDLMPLLNLPNEKLVVHQFLSTLLLEFLLSRRNTILMLSKDVKWLIPSYIFLVLLLQGRITYPNESIHLTYILDQMIDTGNLNLLF